jgi:hypothetical protein
VILGEGVADLDGRRATCDRTELADRGTSAAPADRPVTSQPQLWADPPEPARGYRVAGRMIRARASLFDTFWRFAAERQAVFHRRAASPLRSARMVSPTDLPLEDAWN